MRQDSRIGKSLPCRQRLSAQDFRMTSQDYWEQIPRTPVPRLQAPRRFPICWPICWRGPPEPSIGQSPNEDLPRVTDRIAGVSGATIWSRWRPGWNWDRAPIRRPSRVRRPSAGRQHPPAGSMLRRPRPLPPRLAPRRPLGAGVHIRDRAGLPVVVLSDLANGPSQARHAIWSSNKFSPLTLCVFLRITRIITLF